jgi:hypothetical protein
MHGAKTIKYNCVITEGALVRFGLYLGSDRFESSARPSDVGFRGFSYTEANFELVSNVRPPCSFRVCYNSTFTIHSVMATYVLSKKNTNE